MNLRYENIVRKVSKLSNDTLFKIICAEMNAPGPSYSPTESCFVFVLDIDTIWKLSRIQLLRNLKNPQKIDPCEKKTALKLPTISAIRMARFMRI